MHGTADIIIPAVIARKESLYGYVIPHVQKNSGTLTEDRWHAHGFAVDKLIWHPDATAIILHYLLPNDMLVDHGLIGMDHTAHAWSTTLVVARTNLPEAYRDGIELDDPASDHTGWVFFEVPADYLDDMEYLSDQSPLVGLL